MRDVVFCRYLLELPEADTAAALDIRTGTVKSRLSRALERLQVELANNAALPRSADPGLSRMV